MVISIPTAQRMVLEAGELVKVRTSYELLNNNGNLGHHSDGTTKLLGNAGPETVGIKPKRSALHHVQRGIQSTHQPL